jgi:hypothetical protein
MERCSHFPPFQIPVPVAILTGLQLASIIGVEIGMFGATPVQSASIKYLKLQTCTKGCCSQVLDFEDLKKQCVTTFRKKSGYSAVLCHVFPIHAPYVE